MKKSEDGTLRKKRPSGFSFLKPAIKLTIQNQNGDYVTRQPTPHVISTWGYSMYVVVKVTPGVFEESIGIGIS
jgi:hypothetical protein